jgi:hypothetical protein
VEFDGPPEPGDITLFLISRVHAHGAIVVDWPWVIHAVARDKVCIDDISKFTLGKRALALTNKRYFSMKDDA